MEMLRIFVWLVFVGMGFPSVAWGEAGEMPELAVPVDVQSERRDAAERVMTATLAEYPGTAGKAVEFVVPDCGRGVLWGDLFKTGRCFALVELAEQNAEDADASGVALAEWVDGGWQLRGLWNIPTVWRPEGWISSDDDYLPATPATQPFMLEDLSGDGVPEVVFAGVVAKYFQENFVLRFDPKRKKLDMVGWAMARPERREDYVVLYTSSGRRAIWEEWEYCQWEGGALRPVASWHEEVGYGQNDPTFSEGKRFAADGTATTVRVLYGEGNESGESPYVLSKDGKPFGTMQIAWKDEENLSTATAEAEAAWIFEKTTGLPRRLYPAREKSGAVPRFEEIANVTVAGSAEGMEFFTWGATGIP